ncbi:MAG: tandem-95 repeat protein, partial [Cyanobacteria bacterium J06638_38]
SAGTYDDIELIVSDGHSSNTQILNLTVTNSDRAPVLIPLPLQSTREDSELIFNLKGNDIDGDALLYSAVSQLPQGARLDSRTGEFKWKPNYGQAGDYKFEFAVTDSNGSQDTKEVEIVVANVNRAPSIEVKPQIVALGEALEFTLVGSDADLEMGRRGDEETRGQGASTLVYSVENLPDGATLNTETGLIKWQPSPGQIGDYVVTYQVSDGEDTVEKNALIRVEAEPTPPTVGLEFTPSFPTTPGQRVFINALADSFTEIENITVSVNGEELTLDDRNRVEFIPDTAGRVEVEITATDAAGRTATTTEVLKVRDPEDDAEPIVAFGLGLNGEAFSSATDIVATVDDNNLDEWVLKAEGRGQRAEVLATGFGNISNDVIAQFEPALYANGFYTLELTATDIKGRTSTTEIIVEVEGNDKTAQYQRVENDLIVDFGGTTIDLTRRYDSLQRQQSGSFGNGWQSAWNFELETDVAIRGTGNEAIQPFEEGTKLYLTLPDGQRVGFTFQPIPEEITGLTYYRPAWVADAGVNYTFESADVLLSKAGDRFYDLQTAQPYNLEGRRQKAEGRSQEAYTLTATDGTVYRLDVTGKLQEVISDNTRLIYSDSGILDPDSGEMVRFESDDAGRLTQVTAPNGTAIAYTYDEAGNLVSARNLALGDSVRYSYGGRGLNLIAGDTGEAIEYFDTPVVKPITGDLGTASNFTGLNTPGNGENLYSFGFRESEIQSTNTGFVLLSVDLDGTDGLPTIEGLTPVSTETSTDSSFALYAIEREGLNLLSVNGNSNYELVLGIAGDVNNDNAVDGVDSQLVEQALGTAAGDTDYDRNLDINRDRIIDATDLQILGSNYGFRYNQAPVVSNGDALTHEDLNVEIPLADLATDPEGDRVFFKATDIEHGSVSFTPDGQTVIFKPEVGYTGTASFKLFADDGYAVSDASIVEINVSDAPLTSLDFVERNPKLEVGEQLELQVIADFADQEDVIVPGDYLNWSSESEEVARVSDRGVITGVRNGTTIFSTERDGLSAATVSRVGDIPAPTDEASFNLALAEEQGLDIYPDAVTLTPGVDRQILVGIEGNIEDPELLSDTDVGTRYFVSNPEVLTVDENGLITTIKEGEADIAVIHSAAEAVLPVNVEAPNIGATTLGTEGGVVEGDGGLQVMIPEGALTEDVIVSIDNIAQEELSLDVPEKFDFAGGFNLEIGDEVLEHPAQLAIPAPEGIETGQEVFLMRKADLPNENGELESMWQIAESGTVGNDGMIRTSSPPWNGVEQTGEYSIVIPKFEYRVEYVALAIANAVLGTALISAGVATAIYANRIGKVSYLTQGFTPMVRETAGLFIAAGAGYYANIPVLLETATRSITALTIPKFGLPYTTDTGVEINPGQFCCTLSVP